MAKKFTGPLAQSADLTLSREESFKVFWTNIALLFEHYSIAPPDGRAADEKVSAWAELVLEMAKELVPYFKGVKLTHHSGRPRKSIAIDIFLLADVQGLVEKRGCSVSEAISLLVRLPEFAKHWKGKNKRTLENRYYVAARSAIVRHTLDQLSLNIPDPRK